VPAASSENAFFAILSQIALLFFAFASPKYLVRQQVQST